MASTKRPEAQVGLMEGPAELPRKNGELVFEAPWEGRAFGLAVAMSERQHYAWEEFRQRLIAQIAEAEACGARSTYYERWLAALESLLVGQGMVTAEELDARTAKIAAGEREEHDHH